jgi:hypothetical protein
MEIHFNTNSHFSDAVFVSNPDTVVYFVALSSHWSVDGPRVP